MPDWLPEAAAAVLAAILAITLHEAAHGYAALALGDDTAKRAGRISLNPIRHVDPVGTLLVPGLMVLGQLLTIGRVEAMFGWAKPVPVDIWRLRNPRWGMVLVAAAGPAINAALAFSRRAAGACGAGGARALMGPDLAEFLLRFAALSILANLVLGLFNLLPLPPLDGGRILVGMLPRAPAIALARARALRAADRDRRCCSSCPWPIPAWDPMSWFVRNIVAPAYGLVLSAAGLGGLR